ncbi:MAG TPA: AsnC family transcriptional regulator, partial [Candidatus Norongarragalinales archaeon]|nr:AsnC family transcriptional regulator [Candidatus Norongarragalinales archaeon]
MDKKLDELDEKLVWELSGNSRRSLREIAKKLGSSTSTVAQRVRRLEQEKIVKRYGADLDWEKLGL